MGAEAGDSPCQAGQRKAVRWGNGDSLFMVGRLQAARSRSEEGTVQDEWDQRASEHWS